MGLPRAGVGPCRFSDIAPAGHAPWYNGRMTDQTQITLTAPESVNMALVVGQADELLHLVQDAFSARITVRGDTIVLEGDPTEVQSLTALFSDLIKVAEAREEPTPDYVRRAIDLLTSAEFSPTALREDILLTYRGRAIRPKTAGQKRYVDAIRMHTVTFGIGPAGTGKTYLAMAMAVAALKRKEVGRIILTRPVVEAGESLGFLPGTLTEKVDPYIRPLYDALFDMTDMERAQQLIEGGVIEIAPLAFMRGRTLNDSFIILDEAQNTTPEQMKMFLTRLGFGSKMVVTGDVTQLDLPRGVSGLKDVRRIHMDIQINYDYRREDLEPLPLEELTRFVLAREDKPFNTEVSVSFVTDEAITQLNEKYRHKEGPTDVLSFECDGVDDDLSAMTLAEDPVYELGDVVIAPDVATRQTREFGTTFEEEISLLLVHGLLHLCGYDHIEDDEAEVMEKREAEILEAWSKR